MVKGISGPRGKIQPVEKQDPVIVNAPEIETLNNNGTPSTTTIKTVKKEKVEESSELGNIMRVNGDVIRDYPWGITANSQIKLSEVPAMILTEFEPNNSAVLEALAYTTENAIVGGVLVAEGASAKLNGKQAMAEFKASARQNAYVKMYSGIPTGNVFILPYFDPYNHAIQTEWKEFEMPKVKNELGQKLLNAFSTAAKAASQVGAAASGQYATLSKRLVYGGIAPANVTTTFHLFNTLSDNPHDIIYKNLLLVRALISNNLPDKTSVFTLSQPVIYALEIPGVRYAPAAYASTVQVSNVGQVNRITFNDGSSCNIPDAWEITIQLTEMLPETRNIYEGAFSGKSGPKVTVLEGM